MALGAAESSGTRPKSARKGWGRHCGQDATSLVTSAPVSFPGLRHPFLFETPSRAAVPPDCNAGSMSLPRASRERFAPLLGAGRESRRFPSRLPARSVLR
jgi:hypothetical protein